MSDHTSAQHVSSLRTYLGVGGALLFLTVVTVAVSFVDLGGLNVVVALLIASLKGSLVVLFFMHLLYDNKIYLTVFLAALVFLSILIIFTMFDTMTRDEMTDGSMNCQMIRIRNVGRAHQRAMSNPW